MKSFIIVTVLTFFCFGIAGVSSRFVDQEEVTETVNKTLFKDKKYVEKEELIKIEDALSLNIESFSEDVIFAEDNSLQGIIKINYYEIYDKKTEELLYPLFKTVNVNKSLSIKFEPAKEKYDTNQVSINLKFPHFSITDSTKKRKEMRISVPKVSNLKSISLENLSGDVNLSGLVFESLSLKVTSGDITIEKSKFNNLEIESRSGDIDFDELKLEDLKITSTSGDMNFEDTNISKSIELNSTSGDIEIEGLIGKGRIKSTAGDINIQTKSLNPSIDISSTAGDVELHFLEKPSVSITTSTFAGDISIDGADRKRKRNPLTVGKGEGTVAVATTAGDISITTKD